ncbi:MAG: hypothetical protein ACT4QC_22130 [Planctomycetaceae bacterium]
MKVLDLPQDVRERRMHGFFDDFDWYLSPHRWTSLAADAGASVAAGASSQGGAVVLTTGATDNNEAAVGTTNSPFKMADDKPLFFEARLQYAEANTDDANVFAGFADGLNSANMLVDNGAGPKTSFSGAGIYKVDGETAWRCISSKGGTQTITQSTKTAGGSLAQVLRVELQPIDGASAEATFYVDDEPLRDAAGNVIKHTIALASAAAMQAGVYAKAGSGNSEVVNVDYVAAYQLR